MIISVLQENLAAALASVVKVAGGKHSLPVLDNVLLVAEGSRLMVAATNLQMSVTVWLGAKVERPGSITLPARTFSDLINKLSKERVDLILDSSNHTVKVKCGTTTANVKGIDADEYPPINHNNASDVLISAKLLKEMVAETLLAAAKDEARPILTGICVQIKGDKITMAAADGYRLSVRYGTLENAADKAIEIVIPGTTLNEVARMLDDTDAPVSISLPGERDVVTFHLTNIDVTSQLLEGRFPDFMAIVPHSHTTSATINAADLLRKAQTAMIFAKDNSNSARLKLDAHFQTVTITGTSAERGASENTIPAVITGDPLDGSFNVRYLIDLLGVLKGEEIVFTSNGAANPGVIRPAGREDFTHIIMPMSKD